MVPKLLLRHDFRKGFINGAAVNRAVGCIPDGLFHIEEDKLGGLVADMELLGDGVGEVTVFDDFQQVNCQAYVRVGLDISFNPAQCRSGNGAGSAVLINKDRPLDTALQHFIDVVILGHFLDPECKQIAHRVTAARATAAQQAFEFIHHRHGMKSFFGLCGQWCCALLRRVNSVDPLKLYLFANCKANFLTIGDWGWFGLFFSVPCQQLDAAKGDEHPKHAEEHTEEAEAGDVAAGAVVHEGEEAEGQGRPSGGGEQDDAVEVAPGEDKDGCPEQEEVWGDKGQGDSGEGLPGGGAAEPCGFFEGARAKGVDECQSEYAYPEVACGEGEDEDCGGVVELAGESGMVPESDQGNCPDGSGKEVGQQGEQGDGRGHAFGQEKVDQQRDEQDEGGGGEGEL